MPADQEMVRIIYTNYRGETSERLIRPIEIRFESSEWHTERQWILRAFDCGKNAERGFAIKDIHTWMPLVESVSSSPFAPSPTPDKPRALGALRS